MQKIIQEAIEIIKKNIKDVMGIYIFGSFATSFATKESDLDIAILGTEKFKEIFLWELAQKIASKINKDVDLVDLLNVSTVLRFQIINEGKLVYCRDKKKCNFFENKTDSLYLDLNIIRKDILEDIKKRKGVY
jgi:predicted nucleotidyltransferase